MQENHQDNADGLDLDVGLSSPALVWMPCST